jgi:NADH dehydrogenase FAD-containing subunit
MQFQHLNHLNTVKCVSGTEITYDYLVVCPGIQLDWNKIEGLEETLGKIMSVVTTLSVRAIHGK